MNRQEFERKIREYSIYIYRKKKDKDTGAEVRTDYLVCPNMGKDRFKARTLCRLLKYPDYYRASYYMKNGAVIYARFKTEDEAIGLINKILFDPKNLRHEDLGEPREGTGIRAKGAVFGEALEAMANGTATKEEEILCRMMPDWAVGALGCLAIKEESDE